jgi:hypothetical protein
VSDSGTGMDAETLPTCLYRSSLPKPLAKARASAWLPFTGSSNRTRDTSGCRASGAADALAAAPENAEKTTGRLLIVEDEDAVQSLMVKACVDAGYEVLDARHVDEALALIASYPKFVTTTVVSSLFRPVA